MTNPGNYKYTKEHEWVIVENGIATVGVTDFAQSELGEIVFVDLPAVGKKIAAGDPLCVLESTKAASDVYAPVGGVVKELNSSLRDDPAKVNSSPFADGWLVKLEPVNESDLAALMTAKQYDEFVSAGH